MAITILLEPQAFQPTYNEIITVLSSTKVAEVDFKFVIDVNIAGVNKSRMKVNPNPENFGVVDLHKHIEPFISSDIDYTETETFQLTPNTQTKYDITLFEEYLLDIPYTAVAGSGGFCEYDFGQPHYLAIGDNALISNSTVPAYDGVQLVTSVPTANKIVTDKAFTLTATGDMQRADGGSTLIPSATVFSESKYANSSVLDWLDVPNFDEDDYKINSTDTGLLLTTGQLNYVREDSKCFLNFYNSNNLGATYLRVTTDNGEFLVTNDNYTASNDAQKFLTVGCGADQLENTTNTVIVNSGSLPMFDSSILSYTVQLADVAENDSSQLYTFNINRDCSKYDLYNIVYQDQLGSFIPLTFDRASKETITNKKTNFKKNYGTYNSVANTWGYESKDRGVKRLDTDITENIEIQSNWITEVEGDKVIELMNSPEVYLDDGTQLISINISTNRIVKKKRVTDSLINYKLSFNYSFKNTVQRG